jgi:predicted CXXCH cytochrome family protein
MPESVHEAIGDPESICEEERQLFHQRRMYVLLHAWTLVHVPISTLLLVLGGIHALIATRYCAQCHAKAAASAVSTDLLLPGIEICRQCHNSGGHSACSECHVYHDPGRKPRGWTENSG